MTRTKILIADDDPIILVSLERGLVRAGYEVILASDGKEAVRLGCTKRPDLAVLDIRMPGIFGIEVARQLRDQAAVPSIYLSAYADRELVELATKEGALGYLVKPVQVVQLIPAIEAALERNAELRRLQESEISLTGAVKSNRTISLAIGIYMERFKVSERQATDAMRRFARSRRRKLVDLARTLTGDSISDRKLLEKVRDFSELERHLPTTRE